MRYIGAFCIVLATLIAWRGYQAYLSEELGFIRAFLGALEDYRDGVRCYLKPLSEWAAEYSDGRLASVGFLSLLSDGEDALSAYRAVKDRCYLPMTADEVLDSAFSGIGKGYLEGEIEALDDAVSRLGAQEKELSVELSKRQRVAGALLGALAVGTVILVI